MNQELMIVRKIAGLSVTTAIIAFIAVVCLAVGFMAGALASDDGFKPDKYLILPERSETDRIVLEDEHIYEGDSEWRYDSFEDEVDCMAKNIYFEARDQDIQGQIAVGLVTINRVLSADHPSSICGVVWKKNKNKRGKWVAHFSWTLDGKSDTPNEEEAWNQIYRLAEGMLAERSLYNFHDFTRGSDHYHADYVTPFWSKSLTPTIAVGDHLFYSSSPVALTQ